VWLIYGRPVNFHNLDSTADGIRQINFTTADLGDSLAATGPGLMESLEELLENPPNREVSHQGQ
jgi:hypothetical protein